LPRADIKIARLAQAFAIPRFSYIRQTCHTQARRFDSVGFPLRVAWGRAGPFFEYNTALRMTFIN